MAGKQVKPEKLPAREAARVVLLGAGGPMHYREITKVALEQGLVKVRGSSRRKPKFEQTVKTVRSYLAGSVAEKGSEFVRVEPGVFDFRNRKKAEAAAKKAAERAKAAV